MMSRDVTQQKKKKKKKKKEKKEYHSFFHSQKNEFSKMEKSPKKFLNKDKSVFSVRGIALFILPKISIVQAVLKHGALTASEPKSKAFFQIFQKNKKILKKGLTNIFSCVILLS